MAEKAFTQIKEAETRAKAIIENAREEAAQIIKRAEEEATDAFLRFSETHSKQGCDNKKQTETDAYNSSNEFSRESDELCAALKQKMLLNKQKAVNEVIQIITTNI